MSMLRFFLVATLNGCVIVAALDYVQQERGVVDGVIVLASDGQA